MNKIPDSNRLPTPESFVSRSVDEEIEIRRADVRDLPQIQQFIARTYGPTAPFKGPDRWHWQYVDNPFRPSGDRGPTVWIAIWKDEVIGQIAIQDATLYLDGSPFSAGWIVDVMVAPEFRGRGLSHAIHNRILRDRHLLVTLTMAPATRRIAERAGCVTLGPTVQYIRALRISRPTVQRVLADLAERRPRLQFLIQAFSATLVGPIVLTRAIQVGAMARTLFRARAEQRDFQVEEVSRFPDAINQLWMDGLKRLPAVFERSARFLNWRFCDSPGLDYRRFLLRREGVIRGYLVTRQGHPAELPLGVVVDFFAPNGDQGALDTLLAHAQDVLAPHCEYLEAAASSPAYRAALERAKFIATRVMRPTVVCSDIGLRERIADTAGDWHFTKADHDWDQVHPKP